jgi:hypothetical protein
VARKLGIYMVPLLIAAMLGPAGAAEAAARSAAPRACSNWVQTKSPNIGTGDNSLAGVAAISASDAWAVGYAFFGVNTKSLAEHWNGKSWRVIKSANTGTGDQFKAVYAVSSADVWAVGSYFDGMAGRNLIEHGTASPGR